MSSGKSKVFKFIVARFLKKPFVRIVWTKDRWSTRPMSCGFEIYRSRVKRCICIYSSGNFIVRIVIGILTSALVFWSEENDDSPLWALYLWMLQGQKKLIEYFKNRGTGWCEGIEVFCSDMWQGFLNTAKAVFPNATRVVDRFHFGSSRILVELGETD